MSVEDVYGIAERKGKCRACGKETDDLTRGRCDSCEYKNLEPIE